MKVTIPSSFPSATEATKLKIEVSSAQQNKSADGILSN